MKYLWLAGGLLSGITLTSIVFCMMSRFGTFRIDRSNPDKDIYRLDIDNLEGVHKKRYLMLKVDKNADLSQK